MNYPIDLRFKFLTFCNKIYKRDANDILIAYVNQKPFKLKEDIEVFADEDKTKLLYRIQADRMIDFSACYTFSDANGKVLGSIKRKGMRSLFQAYYLIFEPGGQQVMKIQEQQGWLKILDTIIRRTRIAGIFYFSIYNPSYFLSRFYQAMYYANQAV